jgi:anti-sigma28 factor (negative regulator of flagellin synthesis)
MKFGILSRCDEIPSPEDGSLVRQDCIENNETPEGRRERVSRLRQQVRSGTYEIPFSQLVRILASIFLPKHNP